VIEGRRGLVKERFIRRVWSLISLIVLMTLIGELPGLGFAQSSHAIDSGATPFELRPGVIIDPVAGAAYLMNPERGIDKISLSSGTLLWSMSNAAKPVAVFDDRLVAQVDPRPPDFHALPLVILDTTVGTVASRISIPMPTDVVPSVDNRLGTSFATSARLDQNRLTLTWDYSKQTISGVNRPGLEPPRIEEHGAVSIDLKTQRVETLTHQQAITAMRGARKPPVTSPSDAFQTPPQLAGKVFFTTKLEPNRATVKRWDAASGAPLPDIELDSPFAVAIASADGADLVTAKAVGANAAGIENYLWSIYSLTTGERVAQIQIAQSPAAFVLWRSLLIYESLPVSQRINGVMRAEPLEIRAVDVRTANIAWKRAIRDTTFHGSYPPVS
jgi:hypothetical protein